MPAPSMVFTARFAARHFGVDLDVINELAEQMDPEDGCLSGIDHRLYPPRLDYLDKLLNQRRSDFVQES